MNAHLAETTYYLTLTAGYVWSVVQFIAGEPFDAGILFIVTFSFHMYRNAINKQSDDFFIN